MELIFDNGVEKIKLNDFEPIVITEPSVNDDYKQIVFEIQSQNPKIVDVLDDLDKIPYMKFIIHSKNFDDNFFGDFKILNKNEVDNINCYSISIIKLSVNYS